MRSTSRYPVMAVLVALLAAGSARAQAPKGGGLFDSDEILQFRLTTDLKALMEDRDSLKAEYHPASLSYLDAAGQPVSIDVQLKTRGHWRRQKKNCDFAPIKVDFP